MKLFPQTSHLQLILYDYSYMEYTFKAMQCQKCREYFKMKKKSKLHLQKKALYFVVVFSRRSRHFKHIVRNPKPKQLKNETSTPIPP